LAPAWSGPACAGFLLLRGVPAPYPSNLAQAVWLASQGAWALAPGPAPAGGLDARLAPLEAAARELLSLVEGVRAHLAPAPALARPAADGAAPSAAERQAEELRETCRVLEAGQAEAELRCAQAQAEAATLRIRVEELEARLAERPAVAPQPVPDEAERDDLASRLAEAQAALEIARTESAALRERLAEAVARVASPAVTPETEAELEGERQLRAQAEAERDARRSEAEQAANRIEELRTTLEAERLRRETDAQSLDGARQALKISEEMLAGQTAELENLRRQRTALHEQVEAAQRARAASEAERDRSRAEVNPLWATIESLQRELKDGQARAASEAAQLQDLRAAHEQALARNSEIADALAAAEARASAGDEARERASQADEAERRAAQAAQRWESGATTLRAAWLALKRTPFVPPTLRLAFGSAQSLFEAEPGAPAARRARVLLLDRDTPSLEPLAAELEADGLDVLVAHYADEAAFFLKTPDARQLTALVADVMAFRSDAELLERFRVWRLELPALGLLVSFRADDPAESERARRVPVALGAGHVPRPLTRQAVVDALAVAAKRAVRRTP
jgi:hypothetical protein